MFRNDSHRSNLIETGDRECFATVVLNVPDVHHAFSVASDKAIETLRAVDADQRMLVTFQPHDISLLVRVPHQDLEVEADGNENFVGF